MKSYASEFDEANFDLALVGAGWVGEADFPEIPQVKDKPASIVYGPLSSLPVRIQ